MRTKYLIIIISLIFTVSACVIFSNKDKKDPNCKEWKEFCGKNKDIAKDEGDDDG